MARPPTPPVCSTPTCSRPTCTATQATATASAAQRRSQQWPPPPPPPPPPPRRALLYGKLMSGDAPPGRNVMLDERASVLEMWRLASILRSSRNAALSLSASLMRRAASASPSARMTLATRSCSFMSTVKPARSAFCCATCFSSMARVNSGENERCVMATSSSTILNSSARSVSRSRTVRDTTSRCVMSSSASNLATTALMVSKQMEGSMRSS
mmetsp:Transcript_3391/g.8149  ORF Transcript_3391/g.8149 Transcript_3391/m.8149 type:complete len:213 (-) Transcript_3391:23-661(-)